jgi:RNA polymerase sigma-70 factor (ECF subfamily)
MKNNINQLVENYGLIISRVSHRMIDNNELAKEAAQEVWYEIIKSIDSFKGNSEISTWIYTVTKRTILRYAQNERIIKEKELSAFFDLGELEYNEPENNKKDWVKQQCDSCLNGYFHCLNNEARLIFLFKNMANLSYSQIGIIMELGEDNVRQIFSRSKEKIKNFMDGNCPLYNPIGTCKCRIRKYVISIEFDKEFDKLERMANLVNFFEKFDKLMPSKNYWENFLTEVVTD